MGILVIKRSEEETGGWEDRERESDSSGNPLLFIPGDAPLSSVSLANGLSDPALAGHVAEVVVSNMDVHCSGGDSDPIPCQVVGDS